MSDPMNTTPKCPYCGEEMLSQCETRTRYNRSTQEWLPLTRGWFECPFCLSRSPRTVDPSSEKSSVLALSAALQRYIEPNRVLTLDEVTGSNEPCVFLEIKGKEPIWACDCVISSNLNGVNISFIGDRGCTLVAIFDYCKTWRCWLRRPTDEERQSVAWEESQ